jgi:hypothetical protein
MKFAVMPLTPTTSVTILGRNRGGLGNLVYRPKVRLAFLRRIQTAAQLTGL